MDTPERRAADPVLVTLGEKMDVMIRKQERFERIVDGAPDEGRVGLRQKVDELSDKQDEAEKRELALKNKIDGMVILLRLIGAAIGAAGLVAGGNFLQGLFS